MTRALMTFALLLLAAPALAQTTVPVIGTERLAWDQEAESLAEAQRFAYTPLVNVAIPLGTEIPFIGVTCTGTVSPFVCSAPVPALTPGLHQLRVVASVTVEGTTLASLPSDPLTVVMTIAPVAPGNLRLVRP